MHSHGTSEVAHDGNVHIVKLWLASFLGLVAFALGYYGLWVYEECYGEAPDPLTIGYHTLQLFFLHSPHLDHPVPQQLNWGRWIAAGVTSLAIIDGLRAAFRSEWPLLWARLRGGHIVICGLGRLGSQLAREARQKGEAVVVIEANGEAQPIATIEHTGAVVIIGDASSTDVLLRASAARASIVVAACDDDPKNVAIAARVGGLLKEDELSWWARHVWKPRNRLDCWLFIQDSQGRQFLKRRERVFPNEGVRFRVEVRGGLDLFEYTARHILRTEPLDYDTIKPVDKTVVHLVIVGFGVMGQRLALQAAKTGRFANSERLKITIFDSDPQRYVDFTLRYKGFGEICAARFSKIDESALFAAPDALIGPAVPGTSPELTTVALCWQSSNSTGDETSLLRQLEQDDFVNARVVLSLGKRLVSRLRILVYQTRVAGYGALFSPEHRGDAIGPQIRAFGMVENTLSAESLLYEREDEIAKALHTDFYNNELANNQTKGSRPSMFPWDELEEQFKDSNRRAADHIGVKLRAIGYIADRERVRETPIANFSTDQKDLLARMEHESWCAELFLDGYRYAPGARDRIAKTHPNLLPWDQLDPDTQKKDVEQVEAIPEALKRAGYGIYPWVR